MLSSALPSTGFRTDINGLRALAVLSVLLFHFGLPGLQGGFYGVDIFFVISGFLMAGIVLSGIDKGAAQNIRKGSLWLGNFYLARMIRIWPALMAVILTTLLLTGLFLMSDDYEILGKHAKNALLGLSNQTFLKEAGYFDSASTEKWLLHSWSLAVEWQFYMVYPLILLVAARLGGGRKALLGLHLGGMVASFLAAYLVYATKPDAAFYLLPTRAWELLAGGAVYLVGSSPRHQPRLQALGLLLILVSVVFTNAMGRWEPLHAILPVLGTAMVLYAASANSRMLGVPVAQWLGNRSYSIYLWHWPLIVGLAYFGVVSDWRYTLTGFAVAIALGALSYHVIEKPSQAWLKRQQKWVASAVLLAFLGGLLAIAQIARETGMPWRLPDRVNNLRTEALPHLDRSKLCETAESCRATGDTVAAYVFGDSHAEALAPALLNHLSSGQRVHLSMSAGCPTVIGVQPAADNERPERCEAINHELARLATPTGDTSPVVLITRLTLYLSGQQPGSGAKNPGVPLARIPGLTNAPTPEFHQEFQRRYLETICAVTKQRPVFLVRPVPEFKRIVPHIMGSKLVLGQSPEATIPQIEYTTRHKRSWDIQDEAARTCGAKIIDPTRLMCDGTKCYGSHDGKALYYDRDHLGRFGTDLITPAFAGIIPSKPAK